MQASVIYMPVKCTIVLFLMLFTFTFLDGERWESKRIENAHTVRIEHIMIYHIVYMICNML